jgi:protein phosphatase
MRVEAGAATDVGKVRDHNEDGFLVDPPIYAVADGMGGARGGEVASQVALQTIDLYKDEQDNAEGGSPIDLSLAVRLANTEVFARASADASVAGMGTTLTAISVAGDEARVAHVGDSRAYMLRAGHLRQLTQDHTLVNRMVQAGELSREEAEVHPHRNILIRVVGTEPDIDVDEFDIGLLGGDRILLCSDGLTAMITEAQIQAILEAAPDPQEAADRLIRAANGAGGIDNITAIVLDLIDDQGGGSDTSRAESDHSVSAGRALVRKPAGPTVRKAAVATAVAIGVVVVGLVALRGYLDRQWYVGVSPDGNVAIYQGLPAEVAGFELSHVDLVTELPAEKVAELRFYANLAGGITAADRADALTIVAQMREDIANAQQAATSPPASDTNGQDS